MSPNGYFSIDRIADEWIDLATRRGGETSVVGRSVDGRELLRVDFGDATRPAVLLSSLMHGIELIGGLALLASVRAALEAGLGSRLRLVVLPVVNPDGVAHNVARHRSGRAAFRRGNTRGVDLNRNFPPVARSRLLHPFAGSTFAVSPHYAGPHPLSEPESRAIVDVARAVRPLVSLGFHSFGEVLLYPFAHSRRAHPRALEYRRLAAAFRGAQPGRRYGVRQASHLYPTLGDLDDFLDARFDTLSLTIEVGRPGQSWRAPRRWLDPLFWMNPTDIEGTVANVVPGVVALLEELAGAAAVEAPSESIDGRVMRIAAR